MLNVFRMFGKMGGQRLTVASTADPGVEMMRTEGVRGAPDVSALASLEDRRICVMVWHYHDDDLLGREAAVGLSVTGLPWANGVVQVKHYRIDATHSNAYEFWKRLRIAPKSDNGAVRPTPKERANWRCSRKQECPGRG